jgi:hypothetical protein
MRVRPPRKAALALVTLAAGAGAWFSFIRPRSLRWGTVGDEATRSMPGDDLVTAPRHVSTRAITVRARPDEIWPWLAQMGKGRGGLYSIDWLDRLLGVLDAPSAERVLPEWQDLKPGDLIPVGGSAGWPVSSVERNHALVLRIDESGVLVTQSWGLFPVDAETTRLVLRIRAAAPPGWRTTALLAALEPQELVMVRAQLRGIRRRAEALADERRRAAVWRQRDPPDRRPEHGATP